MPRLTPQHAQTFTLHGVTFTACANSATGAAELAGWWARFDPQTPGQEHRMSREELLYVLDGSLQVEMDGDSFTARTGDCVLVPAGARFRVSNDGSRQAQAWVVTRLGMTATMTAGGEELAPPWAQ